MISDPMTWIIGFAVCMAVAGIWTMYELPKALMMDENENLVEPNPTPTLTTTWTYEWLDASPNIHIYSRWRMEQALDGMGKPFAETLAYLQRIDTGRWRILLHNGDKDLKQLGDETHINIFGGIVAVEKYFEAKENSDVSVLVTRRDPEIN